MFEADVGEEADGVGFGPEEFVAGGPDPAVAAFREAYGGGWAQWICNGEFLLFGLGHGSQRRMFRDWYVYAILLLAVARMLCAWVRGIFAMELRMCCPDATSSAIRESMHETPVKPLDVAPFARSAGESGLGPSRAQLAWVRVLQLGAAGLRLRAALTRDKDLARAMLLLRVELLARAAVVSRRCYDEGPGRN